MKLYKDGKKPKILNYNKDLCVLNYDDLIKKTKFTQISANKQFLFDQK